jgi:RNA polymerase sigma factor (sigma-70 family)
METKVEISAGECAIWRDFRNGDPSALASIFKEHYDSLYYYGLKLVADEDLVMDCVQNLFLKLWTKRETLGAITYVKPYLLKALRRHIGDDLAAQHKRKQREEQLEYDFDVTFSHEDFLIATQISKEQGEALSRCLNNLSQRQREALFLKFYEGLDYEKISGVMALNIQSVRNLIYQSLKSLKENMSASNATLVLRLEVSA